MNRTAIHPGPRGFTIVELLVVIGIIVLLAGILTPMAIRAMRSSEIARVKLDLQTISTALEAYKQDHGDYPRIGNYSDPDIDSNQRGARLLVRALIAPYDKTDDGADGPGFRTRRIGTTVQGPVHGPYLNLDGFHLGPTADLPFDPASPAVLFDKMKSPILYFAARGNRNTLVGNATTAPFPYYNYADNTAVAPNLARFSQMLLDEDNNDNPRTTAAYLLWCAGIDDTFGTDDDITNFSD